MRFAIFSDIHGNISGMKAVLRAIDEAGGADMLIAAGDLVGGGPGTEDLLDLLQEHQVRMVRGNAEEVWLDMDAAWNQMYLLWREMEPDRDFDHERAQWMEALQPTTAWIHKHLSQPYLDLLAGLPTAITVDAAPGAQLLVCHATPDSPWPPITGADSPTAQLRAAFGPVGASVITFGHIHQHHTRQLDGKLLLNVASVTAREDIPGHSAYTLLDFDQGHWLVRQMLVPYDTAEEEHLRSERGVPAM